jgi:signal transduction histidine kinase
LPDEKECFFPLMGVGPNKVYHAYGYKIYYNLPVSVLNCFKKNIAMKKFFLLQAFYVLFAIALLSLLWEFVLEGVLFADATESFDGKVEYVLTTITFVALALIYPTYKGLSIISSWKELEKTLVDQGLQLNREITSLDSIKSVLMDELLRRKKAEEGIENERQKFFNMLDQLPVCFHLQASDYTVPFANKMFRDRFGDPEKGKCYQLMHERSTPCEPCGTFKVFDSLETESSVWTSQDDKTYLTVVTAFDDLDGTTVLMEMAIDITSEQKAKDELKHTLDLQEERIKERTRDLEQSNNALQDFSSFAAHDLKEPLRKIMIFSERVQVGIGAELEGTGQQYLTGLRQAAERMDNLIDDLLKLSQMSSQKITFKTVDLNKVMVEVIDDLEPSFPGCKESISVQTLPKVKADRSQMYQLFKNLLSNSLKYAKAEEPPKVFLKVEMNARQQYLIAIRDNGIGFDEKHKERIFKPFERLHGQSEYSGTGIGLAICKKVVELHEGELDVESKIDSGTTFTVCFPIPKDAL